MARKSYVSELWSRLVLEGNFTLINNLRRAERREPGYCTMAVSKDGFSKDDKTHNLVLWFLKKHRIRVLNPGLEAARATLALRGHNATV